MVASQTLRQAIWARPTITVASPSDKAS